jgi:hypothetical protein
MFPEPLRSIRGKRSPLDGRRNGTRMAEKMLQHVMLRAALHNIVCLTRRSSSLMMI